MLRPLSSFTFRLDSKRVAEIAPPTEPSLADLQAQIVEMQRGRVDAYHRPKIANFFRENPSAWFVQAEVALRNARITTQHSKADFIVEKLDCDVVTQIEDLISHDPVHEDIYDKIKKRILSLYATSSEARLRKLLKGEVLTDGKPSLILGRLRSLNEGRCSDAIMKSIFLDQLAAQCRSALSISSEPDLQKIAEMADRFLESNDPNKSYIAADTDPKSIANTPREQPPAHSVSDKVDRLATKVDQLTEALHHFRT